MAGLIDSDEHCQLFKTSSPGGQAPPTATFSPTLAHKFAETMELLNHYAEALQAENATLKRKAAPSVPEGATDPTASEIERLKAEIERLQQDLASLGVEAEGSKQAEAIATAEVAKLRADHEAKMEASKKEMEELRRNHEAEKGQQAKEHEDAMRGQSEKLEAVSAELEEANEALDAAKQSKAKYKNALGPVRKKNQELVDKLAAQEQEVSRLQKRASINAAAASAARGSKS